MLSNREQANPRLRRYDVPKLEIMLTIKPTIGMSYRLQTREPTRASATCLILPAFESDYYLLNYNTDKTYRLRTRDYKL